MERSAANREKYNVGEHSAIASNLNRTHDRKNFRYSRFQNPELYLLRKSLVCVTGFTVHGWFSPGGNVYFCWKFAARRPRTFSP